MLTNPLENFQISRVRGLGIEHGFILMVQIGTSIHIEKDILAVRQTFNVQARQYVHKAAGINAGTGIADTFLTVKNGSVMDVVRQVKEFSFED